MVAEGLSLSGNSPLNRRVLFHLVSSRNLSSEIEIGSITLHYCYALLTQMTADRVWFFYR